jgi:type I restriction enzyme S subunit
LGDVCEIEKRSVMPKRGEYYVLYSLPAFDESKTPERVMGEEIKSGKFIVTPNTILFNKLNVRFKRVWNINFQPCENSVCSTEFIPIKPNGCDQAYLYYVLVGDELTKTMESHRTGTSSSHQRINVDSLLDFEIDLPPLPVQRAIADTLSALDAKIANNTKINNHLEQMAQAIFAEICGEGEPAILSDILTVCYGKDHKRLADGEIPCYGSGGIMRYVDKALYEGESVLIPRKGTLNNVLYINEPFWTVDTMFYTHMTRPNVAKFVYFTMRNLDLAGMNVGSAVPSMTTTVLNALEIILPSDATLAKFEESVSTMFFQMQHNNAESARLSELRDTLLPRLMSGELSVADIGDAK